MRVGHYELEGLLGRGTFGAVYAARDAAGARVAVKLIASRAEAVDRTEREGRLHALLGVETGFVPLLESGEHAGQRYLVMPLLEGGTLRDRLARGALPVADAVSLGLRLAAAIGRAHSQGVVHRDLKPENIIFTKDGAPLIADLGLAKHWDHAAPGASQSVSLTRSGELVGTAGYMAPEQIGTKEASAAADVYALGAILYECLAGEPPFRAETVVELLARVTTGVFAPLRPRRPDAPRAFVSAIEAALSRDPGRRPIDGAALAAALGGAGSPSRRRSRNLAVAVGFLGTLLAVGVGAVLRAKPATSDLAPVSSANAPPAPPSPRVPLAPPPPVQPPLAPAPALDPLTAGFRATKTFKLVQVMGGFGGKHGYGIQDAAWLGDARAVSVGIDHALRIWDLEPTDGAGRLRVRERRSIVDHAERIEAVAVAPDGKRIVDASRDKTLRVYDPAVSPSIAELKGHEKAVVAVAYSPDGTRVVSGSEDGTARIWDVERAATLHTLACGSPVTAVAWSPVGERIVTGQTDGSLCFWSTDGTALPALLPKLAAAVSRIAFSPDGRRIVLGLANGTANLFDLTTFDQWFWPAHKKFVASAGFARGGERVFTASGDTFDIGFRLWDAATRKLLWTKRGHADGVVSVALSPDGRRLLTGSHDRSIGVHDVETGEPLLAIDGHASAIETVELSADGRTALTCSWDWTIRLWDLETGRERSRIDVTGPPTMARFSSDEKLVLIAHYEGDVRIHEVATGKRLRAVKPTSQPVFAMDVAPGSDWFATGGVDGKVRLHDIATGAEKRSLDLGGGQVLSVAIAADGQRVFAATRDGKVRAWDLVASSNLVRAFEFADAQGACVVALSSDPTRVLVGGRSGVNLSLPIEATAGRRIAKAHRAPVAAIVQGATSGRIFSASGDGNVVVRHGKSLDFLDAVSLSSSTDAPAALALSKDERTLLVGTNRGVLLRFEVAPE